MDGRSSLLAVPSPSLSIACRKSSPSVAPTCDKRWRLSLVLPAYDEEVGIRQAIEEACIALDELTSAYEVLVVDDGSCDGTAACVAEVSAQRRQVRLLRHESNRGYGAALRTGFAAARFERVAFTDADCQFHLADLGRMLPLSDRCPLVVGWRQQRQDSWRRRFLSRGYNVVTSLLLGTRVRDCDCALKVFQREVLSDLLPQTNTFFVNAEMLTKARQCGLEVAEVGVRHRPPEQSLSLGSAAHVGDVAALLVVARAVRRRQLFNKPGAPAMGFFRPSRVLRASRRSATPVDRRDAVFSPFACPAVGTARAALRRNPPANAQRGAIPRAGAARRAIPR